MMVPLRRDSIRRWKLSGRAPFEDSPWDLHDALVAACRMISPRSYLEIGVDGGGSLFAVMSVAELDRAVLCDIWDPAYCNHGMAGHDHIARQLDGYVRAPKVVAFLDGDSREKIPSLEGWIFDLITVDGGHTAEIATADLENCWPLLREGGMLAFDDVGHVQYPHLEGVFLGFMDRHPDAVLIPEASADWRNCALVAKA